MVREFESRFAGRQRALELQRQWARLSQGIFVSYCPKSVPQQVASNTKLNLSN